MYFIKIAFISILIFFLAFEGVFSTVSVAGIGISRFIEFIFFLSFSKYFIRDMYKNKVILITVKLMILFGIFLCLKIFVVFILQTEVETKILTTFVRLFFIIFPFYSVYFLMNRYGIIIIKMILLLNFPIMLIGWFQSDITPFTEFGWYIKETFFPWSQVFLENESFRKRVTSVYTFSIPLAYTITVNILLTTYLFVKTKSNIYFIYFLFLGSVAVFTLTRSVVLSWIAMFLYYLFIFLMNKRVNVIKRVLTIILITIFSIYAINIYNDNAKRFSRITTTKGTSAQGRVPLLLTGAYTLIVHPFGVSTNDYDFEKKEMYQIFHVEDILNFPAHNGLINIGFEYTTFGLIVFLLYILIIYRILKNYFSKEMYIYFTYAFFVYMANSFFHNNFIFIQDFYVLIFLGILAYEYDVQKQKIQGKLYD